MWYKFFLFDGVYQLVKDPSQVTVKPNESAVTYILSKNYFPHSEDMWELVENFTVKYRDVEYDKEHFIAKIHELANQERVTEAVTMLRLGLMEINYSIGLKDAHAYVQDAKNLWKNEKEAHKRGETIQFRSIIPGRRTGWSDLFSPKFDTPQGQGEYRIKPKWFDLQQRYATENIKIQMREPGGDWVDSQMPLFISEYDYRERPKYWDAKIAYENGKVVEYYSPTTGKWAIKSKDFWTDSILYRISDKQFMTELDKVKIAFAEGKQIQYKSLLYGDWRDANHPVWSDEFEYRIKPE